jgi:hypothetical protein
MISGSVAAASAAGLLVFLSATPVAAQQPGEPPIHEPLPQAVTERDSERVKVAVDTGLQWLATQFDREGAFSGTARSNGQPGLTSLSIMAYLSRGHRPGYGPYGEILNRSIDFTLSCQKPSGLICYGAYDAEAAFNNSDTYNHAITLLMLGEVFGMTGGDRAIRVRQAIEKGLAFTHALWTAPKSPGETGGWRYIHKRFESDLSVTGWYVAALRSLKNAGFDVPKEVMDRTTKYVEYCYSEPGRSFSYRGPMQPRFTVAMTGAGILSLALAGKPSHPFAVAAGETLSKQVFTAQMPRCYYGCYYATQAAAQLGGQTWISTYRNVAAFLIPTQRSNGQWPLSDQPEYGPVYSTSLAILSLTPHFQLLPIYQH